MFDYLIYKIICYILSPEFFKVRNKKKIYVLSFTFMTQSKEYLHEISIHPRKACSY